MSYITGFANRLSCRFGSSKSFALPEELANEKINVRGVVSLYGPVDLKDLYYQTGQHIAPKKTKISHEPEEMPGWLQKKMGKTSKQLGFDKDVEPGVLGPILGGTPDEIPGVYHAFDLVLPKWSPSAHNAYYDVERFLAELA